MLKDLEKIIRDAGSLAMKIYSSGSLEIGFKGARNLVTRADKETEEFLISELSLLTPGARFYAEETANEIPTFEGLVWVIDPIDGTTNFSHGNPHCAVSVALTENGTTVYGGVYGFFNDELFMAEKGKGAFLNGKKLTRSVERTLFESIVALGFINGDGENFHSAIAFLHKLHGKIREFRRLGAASLDACWVAAGKVDAYFETLHAWDIAAAALIAREAGCYVGTYQDHPRNLTLPSDLHAGAFFCSDAKIADELLSLIT